MFGAEEEDCGGNDGGDEEAGEDRLCRSEEEEELQLGWEFRRRPRRGLTLRRESLLLLRLVA